MYIHKFLFPMSVIGQRKKKNNLQQPTSAYSVLVKCIIRYKKIVLLCRNLFPMIKLLRSVTILFSYKSSFPYITILNMNKIQRDTEIYRVQNSRLNLSFRQEIGSIKISYSKHIHTQSILVISNYVRCDIEVRVCRTVCQVKCFRIKCDSILRTLCTTLEHYIQYFSVTFRPKPDIETCFGLFIIRENSHSDANKSSR